MEKVEQIAILIAEVGGLSTVIFAAVAYLKQWGISGRWLTGSGFAFGLVFGSAYRYFVYHPETGLDWFFLVTFGLVSGFLATGAYKGIESATGKNRGELFTATLESTGNPEAIQERLDKFVG